MFKTKCACGESEKNFKYDIGPYYVDDCCKAAGYNDLGKRTSSGNLSLPTINQAPTLEQSPTINIVPTQPSVPVQQPQVSAPQQSTADRVLAFLGVGAKKLTKSKLENLRVDEIKKIAADRGIAGCETMTRAQLTEALLK